MTVSPCLDMATLSIGAYLWLSLRRKWVLPAPPPQASVSHPWIQRGEGVATHSPAGLRGWGDPIRTTGKKAWHFVYSLVLHIHYNIHSTCTVYTVQHLEQYLLNYYFSSFPSPLYTEETCSIVTRILSSPAYPLCQPSLADKHTEPDNDNLEIFF
jgi:hypothetical protein